MANTLNLASTVINTGKTNNNAVPGTDNIGVLPGVATTAAPSYTEGNQVSESIDLSGNERVTLGTLISGEDQTADLLKVEHRYLTSGVLTSDTLVKSGSGYLHTVTFSQNDAAPTAGTIDIYNNTSGAGTKLYSWTLTTAVFIPFTLTLDIPFTTGLYVDFTTTSDVNVVCSYR